MDSLKVLWTGGIGDCERFNSLMLFYVDGLFEGLRLGM